MPTDRDNGARNSPLITFREGCAGRIILNRPEALNALDLGMVRGFDKALLEWEEDNCVRVITIEGAGERAFCAGGDARGIIESRGTDSTLGADFFREEYRLNRHLKMYPKPIVSFIDGVTMGGGVGVSVHGSHRVATERTLFAMPETMIGLFPDVGGGHFLPRLPGEIGTCLALTGARMGAGDCIAAGIATHALAPGTAVEAVVQELITMKGDDVDGALAPFLAAPAPDWLPEHRETIDRCFAGDTVEGILDRLASEESDWAQKTRERLSGYSPTSLRISLRQLRMGREVGFDEELVTEYRLSQACLAGHDFAEGVRAALIDKDKAPKWQPATLSEVDEGLVDSHFAVPAAGDLTF